MHDETVVECINDIGHFLRTQGHYDAAIRVFDALRHLQPTYIYPKLGHALVSAESGNFSEAIVDFNNVLSREPDHSFAMVCLGLCLLQSGDRRWRKELLRAAQSEDTFGGQALARQMLEILPSQLASSGTFSASSLGRLSRFSTIEENTK